MTRKLTSTLAATISTLALLALLALPAAAQSEAQVSVSPPTAAAGATLSFQINGLWGAENVGAWFTGPGGAVVGYTAQIVTDPSGKTSFNYQTPTSMRAGMWQATVQGLSSKRQAIVSFTILSPGAGAAPGVAAPVQFTVSPTQAAPGDKLTFSVSGLWGAENVGLWFTGVDGTVVGYANQIVTDPGGKATFTFQTPTSMAAGTWQATVQGLSSKRQAITPFTLMAP